MLLMAVTASFGQRATVERVEPLAYEVIAVPTVEKTATTATI